MLVMAKYEWFENFRGGSKGGVTRTEDARLPGYEEIKKKWESRCLDIFLRYFPGVITTKYRCVLYLLITYGRLEGGWRLSMSRLR